MGGCRCKSPGALGLQRRKGCPRDRQDLFEETVAGGGSKTSGILGLQGEEAPDGGTDEKRKSGSYLTQMWGCKAIDTEEKCYLYSEIQKRVCLKLRKGWGIDMRAECRNVVPEQGTRTARLGEAIFAALSLVNFASYWGGMK